MNTSAAPVETTDGVISTSSGTDEDDSSITPTGIVVTASTSTTPNVSLVGISDREALIKAVEDTFKKSND